MLLISKYMHCAPNRFKCNIQFIYTDMYWNDMFNSATNVFEKIRTLISYIQNYVTSDCLALRSKPTSQNT
jgi:hypothetical protein